MTIKEEIAKKRKSKTIILTRKENSLDGIEKDLREQDINSLGVKILNLKLNYIDNKLFDNKICVSFNISKETLAEYYIDNLYFFEKDINRIINSIINLSKTAYQKLFQSEYFLSLIKNLTFEQKMYCYLTLAKKSCPELTNELIQKIVPIDDFEMDFMKENKIKK